MRGFAVLLVMLLCASAAQALQEYRYIEGEAPAATDGAGLREEGFTSWMLHPSGARVMVLPPAGWLEYRVEGLADRPYYVYVRGLAWASGCETDILWDGRPVGRPRYPVPGTALKWSSCVGTVRGPGDHTLRLVADPGITQAPYIDVLLLTTQEGYQPDDADRDFVSFITPLPLLSLTSDTGTGTVAPEPGAPGTEAVEVTRVAAGPLGIGDNEVIVNLAALDATPRNVRVIARLGDAPPGETPVVLVPGAPAEVRVACEAQRPGPTTLELSVLDRGEELLAGGYRLAVPNPVSVSLAEYALPVGTPRAVWRADLTTRPSVTGQIAVALSLTAAGRPEVLASARLQATGQRLEQAFATDALPRGRYVVNALFLRAGEEMLSDRRELRVFDPVSAETWEPVQRTEARGGVILMNGKPFLGRLLYHAEASPLTHNQGFNLVQCAGGDPDPLDSIQRSLDDCAASGLWGTVALFNNRYFLPGDHFDLEHIRLAVERFAGHPALWAWDLIDEPEFSVTPERVAEAADLIRSLDPNHLVWVNLCQPDRATDYLASQDLWSFDYYPIPGQPPFSYMNWIGISDARLRGQRPLGSVMQTYSGPGNRLPTPDELRCMTYLHLLHDYRWLGFYVYYDPPPAGCLARSPELWGATRALNSELLALSPVILDGAPMVACPVEPALEDFQAGEKTVDGVTYLVAVNGSAQAVEVALRTNGSRAEVLLEEKRSVGIVGGLLRDTFGPYAVHVYRVQ
jgi:hypothetical protein